MIENYYLNNFLSPSSLPVVLLANQIKYFYFHCEASWLSRAVVIMVNEGGNDTTRDQSLYVDFICLFMFHDLPTLI